MVNRTILLLCVTAIFTSPISAQQLSEQKGYVSEEIISNLPAKMVAQSLSAVQTSDGVLIAVAARNYSTQESDIYLERPVDKQWSVSPLQAGNRKELVTYPVLFQFPNSKTLLFYKTGTHPSNWKGWLKTSDNNGQTWSETTDLPYKVSGPARNKPVLLPNGDLLCGTYTSGNEGFNNYLVHLEIASDKGKSWKKTEQVKAGKDINALNPVILSYANGKLQMLAQSLNNVILSSWSYDNGTSWWPLAKTEIPCNSPFDAITLKDGRQALLYSHINGTATYAKTTTFPLNLALSEDGETWSAAMKLENSPSRDFSEPVLLQTNDKLLHIFYIWKGSQIKHIVVDPSKLKLRKIKKGEWPE